MEVPAPKTVSEWVRKCFAAPEPNDDDLDDTDMEAAILEMESAESDDEISPDILKNVRELASDPESGKSTPTHPLKAPNRKSYCCYCSFEAASKYSVKLHCIADHPGLPVDASESECVA